MSPLVLSLAASRAAIGAFTWVAPLPAARVFGLEPNPKFSFVARLLGARDVALAAGIVVADGDARRTWLAVALGCDILDLAAAGLAHRDGTMRPQATALAGAAALAGTIMGAAALRQER